jgi:hypothetical protein
MAKKIPIGKDLFALVDDEDYELVSKFNWHKHKSRSYGQYYASSNIKMHRLVMDAKPGEIIDHINGDSLDNRKENLRLCTYSQNQQNTQSRAGSSRYKGVSYIKRKNLWKGSFQYEGVHYHCGIFKSEQECALAVDRKRLEVCKEFAVLNFPDRKK